MSLAAGTDSSATAGRALPRQPTRGGDRAWHSHFSLLSRTSRRPFGQGPERPHAPRASLS